jgi:hypothetical protein
MSIDLTRERGIPAADVPKLPWIPRRRRGSRLSVATVHRWFSPGIRGVRLEHVTVGGTRVTTEAALLRFFAALSAAPAPAPADVDHEAGLMRQRVDQELDAEGL